jgi:formamidopyrimidine-DNA glycosylase
VPELPEVEIVVNGLRAGLAGKRIQDVFIFYEGSIDGDPVSFQSNLLGKEITGVRRRAKLAIIDLEEDLHLVFHLKMTGRLFLPCPGEEPDAHTHLAFLLDDGQQFWYRDVRKFGYARLISTAGLRQWDFYATLGPEPLQIDADDFVRLMQRRKARIKSLLLDQKVLAGIGNIYADEALYLAGIHPATSAAKLSAVKLKELHNALQTVLKQALSAGGSSFRDYVNALGTKGSYQDQFLAYGRCGQPCTRCGHILEKDRVAGRTSVFCPGCQYVE